MNVGGCGQWTLLDIESGSLVSLFQPYVTPDLHSTFWYNRSSGGQCRRHRASDIFIDDSNHDNNYLIMWEVLPSQRLLQLEQLYNSLLWSNEDTLKAGVNNCGFHISTADNDIITTFCAQFIMSPH